MDSVMVANTVMVLLLWHAGPEEMEQYGARSESETDDDDQEDVDRTPVLVCWRSVSAALSQLNSSVTVLNYILFRNCVNYLLCHNSFVDKLLFEFLISQGSVATCLRWVG